MSVDKSKQRESRDKYVSLATKIADNMLTFVVKSGNNDDQTYRLRVLTDKMFDHAASLVMHVRTMKGIWVTDKATFEQFRYHAYEAKGEIGCLSSLLTIAYYRTLKGIPNRARKMAVRKLGEPDKEDEEAMAEFTAEVEQTKDKLKQKEARRFKGFASDLQENRSLIQGRLNAVRKFANPDEGLVNEKQAAGDSL